MALRETALLFRGIAFAIDTFISVLLAMLCNRIFFGVDIFRHLEIMICIFFAFLMLRDVLGKSCGKYVLGLNIVNIENHEKSNFFRKNLKNITSPLTILEIPMIVCRKDHKRIGDMLAKTEVQIAENSWALLLFKRLSMIK